MTYKPIIIIWTIFIGLTLIGCSYSDNKTSDLNTKLLGTWVLDSISTTSGKYYKSENESKIFTIKNKTDYILEWRNGDVGNRSTGKYFVLENPKRGLKTITFVPDIQITDKDTIRTAYMNFDLININSKRFQVVDETRWIKRDSLPYIRFNKSYIYKRTK